MNFRKINDSISVSPQISIADVDKIKAAGFVAIVNNRPDAEDQIQPISSDLQARALKLGLDFYHIPVSSIPSLAHVASEVALVAKILAETNGPILFFCRTGTRSSRLWALSQLGILAEHEIIGMTARAGYDLDEFLRTVKKS